MLTGLVLVNSKSLSQTNESQPWIDVYTSKIVMGRLLAEYERNKAI